MAQVQSIRNKHLMALDLNSGVEIAPGMKDITKSERGVFDTKSIKKP